MLLLDLPAGCLNQGIIISMAIVEDSKDIKQGFWTKPRLWLLVLLLFLELLNFLIGPQLFYRSGVQYKNAGWIEASRICLLAANWANPWSPLGKQAEAYSRARLPKRNATKAEQQRNILGYNQDALGNTQEAIATFEALIKDSPDFEWPYNNLANIMLEQGNQLRAKELCDKALAINPDYANAHLTLAKVLEAQGKTEQAREQVEEAKRLLEATGEGRINWGY